MLTTATSSRARNVPVGNTCSASTTAWIDLGGTSGDVRGSASTQPGSGVRRGGDGKLLSPQSTDLLIETFRLSPRLRPAVSASVVATNSAGQIVTMDIPVSPVLPSRAAVRGVSVDAGAQSAIVSGHAYDELRPKSNACPEPERTAVSAEVASCEEVCSAALALMIGVLTPRGERIQRGHREGQHNLNGREDHLFHARLHRKARGLS